MLGIARLVPLSLRLACKIGRATGHCRGWKVIRLWFRPSFELESQSTMFSCAAASAERARRWELAQWEMWAHLLGRNPKRLG